MVTVYPTDGPARDRFILERRRPRPKHDPWRSQGVFFEDERAADGRIARVAIVLLTGRECPWRCAMCDLWQHTLTTDTPPGAIPQQIAAARGAWRTERATEVKLYNAGSFFDPRAVPDADYDDIAATLSGLSRVVVESHPALVDARVDRFQSALGRVEYAPVLEVAMGLETAHPEALERLNKRMTVGDFVRAANTLRSHDVAVRAFVIIDPPFVPAAEQEAWLVQSVDTAAACGAGVVSLVPTRGGNGAMEALAAVGAFEQPSLGMIEQRVDAVHARHGGSCRIFVDLWDLAAFSNCPVCLDARRSRLAAMNLTQQVLPRVVCGTCGGNA